MSDSHGRPGMLITLARFFGFDRPVPVPLPPKVRRTAAPPASWQARPTSDTLSDTSAGLSDEIAQVRAEQRILVAKTSRPLNEAQAVVVTAKVYGDFRAERAWYRARTDRELDAAALDALGAELHSYCRALYLAGLKTPPVDRRLEFDQSYIRRLVGNLQLDAVSDIDIWERAMHALGEEQKRQRRAGRPITPSLTIPEAVLVAIAARQAERAERLERFRGGRGGTGGSPPSGGSAQGGEGSSGGGSRLKASRKKRDDEDDEGAAPPPPTGPRR